MWFIPSKKKKARKLRIRLAGTKARIKVIREWTTVEGRIPEDRVNKLEKEVSLEAELTQMLAELGEPEKEKPETT